MPADRSFDSFFFPRAVAVVGASRFEGKVGHTILKNLLSFGFKGKIYPVNPKADEILGLKTYSSLEELPKVDLAVFAVPPELTVKLVEEYGSRFKAAVIVAGGFGEAGRTDLDRRLLEASRAYGFRFIGPNCMGILSAPSRLAATFLELSRVNTDIFSGSSVLLSQSGATIAVLTEEIEKRGGNIGFFVSYGNQLDVKEHELLRYFADLKAPKVVGLYIEGPSNGEKLLEAVKAARRKGKEVIFMKAGRGKKAREAARTHTGAVAGSFRVFRDVLSLAGGQVFQDLEAFSSRFSWLSKGFGSSRKVAVITDGGGFGVMVTDALEDLGIDLPTPPVQLLEFLPERASRANPIDLTGDASLELFLRTYRAVKSLYDAVVFVILPQLPAIRLEEAHNFFKNLGPGKRVFLIPGGEEAAKLRQIAREHGEMAVSTVKEVAAALGGASLG